MALVFAAFVMAGTIHAAAGFGLALVGMPILSQAIGVRTAVPLMALLGWLAAAMVLWRNWRGLRWGPAARLIAGSVLGIPLGVAALRSLPEDYVMAVLGVVLLGYGAFEAFFGGARAQVEDGNNAPAGNGSAGNSDRSWTACLAGFCAGVLGGAYATDGPPLIIYGSIRRWPKATFKSILQSCFLANGVFIIFCHGVGGLITRRVLECAAVGLPGLLIGFVVGTHIDRRLNHVRFRRLLLRLIVILGASLLIRAAIGIL